MKTISVKKKGTIKKEVRVMGEGIWSMRMKYNDIYMKDHIEPHCFVC